MKRKARIVVVRSGGCDNWHWRLVSANNKILAYSECFYNYAACVHSASLVSRVCRLSVSGKVQATT